MSFDNIKNPKHYTEGRDYEPHAVIEDWGLNFNLGNALKYISRAGRKGDPLEDLQKARQYINFEIDRIYNERAKEKKEVDDMLEELTKLDSIFLDSIFDDFFASLNK